jgi:hypothetical protein
MSLKGKTLLKGHSLIREGKTYSGLKEGSARCECGQLSPTLPSTNARQLWHAAHKEEIRSQVAIAAKQRRDDIGASNQRSSDYYRLHEDEPWVATD